MYSAENQRPVSIGGANNFARTFTMTAWGARGVLLNSATASVSLGRIQLKVASYSIVHAELIGNDSTWSRQSAIRQLPNLRLEAGC